MKVLTINTTCGGGGAANIANMLHNYINKTKDNKSTFIYGRGSSDDINNYKISDDLSVNFSALSQRFLGNSLNLNFGLKNKLESFIKESDVIHFHNLHGYYINYKSVIELVNKYDKPVVWTFHDMWPTTGRCAYPGKCEKWTTGCNKCPDKELYPKTYIDRSKSSWKMKNKVFNMLNKEKTIISTPSQWLGNEVEKSFLKDFNIKAIPNGIFRDNDKAYEKNESRNDLNLPLNKKIVLFVSADVNDPRKGVKYILEAIKKTESDDVLFVSMGNTINNFESDKLIQLGFIRDREKINKVYSAADIFVIPSMEDNFPTTVLEAMANKTPVIGFATGGIPEQIDEKTGIVVDRGDTQGLIDAINLLINDSDKLAEMSSNALRKFEENYTIDIFAEKHIKMYKSLLK